jgi:hypothetical protein
MRTSSASRKRELSTKSQPLSRPISQGSDRFSPPKQDRLVALVPLRILFHDLGKTLGRQESLEPGLEIWPGLCIEPVLVDEGELADKGQDGEIGKAGSFEDPLVDRRVQIAQETGRLSRCSFGSVPG